MGVPPSTPPGDGIQGPATPTETPIGPSPQVTGISPSTGSSAGGDSVTITGSGFTGATAVDFGGVSAMMQVNSDSQITATSPPGSGIVDVTVTTPSGTSEASPTDQFSYQG
jgi:IPT/TIG domain